MFISPEWNDAESIQLFTDASGFGAYFNGAWFRDDWQPQPKRSIQWQEQLSLGVTFWKDNASDSTVIICP
jgi:hypothetical protein